MEVTLPGDCGNSPRMQIVADFVTAWAAADTDTLTTWLTDDATWAIIGEREHPAAEFVEGLADTEPATTLDVTAIVTHGRLASCDGTVDRGTHRTAFSHVFHFAGATKTAKIREIRSYLIGSTPATDESSRTGTP